MQEFKGNILRGNQIKDNSITSLQIKDKTISNAQISDTAAIEEHKLKINWGNHSNEILSQKKVIDYVQLNKIKFPSNTYEIILDQLNGSTTTTSKSNKEGILIDDPYNRVIIRDSKTGQPITLPLTDNSGNIIHSEDLEIFGKVTLNNNKIYLKLYVKTLDDNSPEIPYQFPESKIIDIQYAQRFNLSTVNEMFAANEKFVNGAADITSYLNISQLANDIYGDDKRLNRDGNGILDTCIVYDLNLLNEFKKSIISNNGASLVGISKIENISSNNVQSALEELSTKISNVSGTTSQEVIEARGTCTTLNERLSRSLLPNGALIEEGKIHQHKKYNLLITDSTTEVYLPEGEKFNLSNGIVSVDSLNVYINGILQVNNIHFEEKIDPIDNTKGNGILLIDSDILIPGDIITFDWIVNNEVE